MLKRGNQIFREIREVATAMPEQNLERITLRKDATALITNLRSSSAISFEEAVERLNTQMKRIRMTQIGSCARKLQKEKTPDKPEENLQNKTENEPEDGGDEEQKQEENNWLTVVKSWAESFVDWFVSMFVQATIKRNRSSG